MTHSSPIPAAAAETQSLLLLAAWESSREKAAAFLSPATSRSGWGLNFRCLCQPLARERKARLLPAALLPSPSSGPGVAAVKNGAHPPSPLMVVVAAAAAAAAAGVGWGGRRERG